MNEQSIQRLSHHKNRVNIFHKIKIQSELASVQRRSMELHDIPLDFKVFLYLE